MSDVAATVRRGPREGTLLDAARDKEINSLLLKAIHAGTTIETPHGNLVHKPSVAVEIIAYRPIYVLGEVNKPGQYAYQPGMTVVTAVAVAGGFTYRAVDGYAAVVRSVEGKAVEGRAMRLGGMVEAGSVEHLPDGVTIRFRVTDGKAVTPVIFRGIVPDLFREGSGVVAEGRMRGSIFTADTILAKHDERYMPPELGNLAAERKAGKTLKP